MEERTQQNKGWGQKLDINLKSTIVNISIWEKGRKVNRLCKFVSNRKIMRYFTRFISSYDGC